ncbi:hypothetical protein BKA93DRAFT_365974 [Sparassis latifolia]
MSLSLSHHSIPQRCRHTRGPVYRPGCRARPIAVLRALQFELLIVEANSRVEPASSTMTLGTSNTRRGNITPAHNSGCNAPAACNDFLYQETVCCRREAVCSSDGQSISLPDTPPGVQWPGAHSDATVLATAYAYRTTRVLWCLPSVGVWLARLRSSATRTSVLYQRFTPLRLGFVTDISGEDPGDGLRQA